MQAIFPTFTLPLRWPGSLEASLWVIKKKQQLYDLFSLFLTQETKEDGSLKEISYCYDPSKKNPA